MRRVFTSIALGLCALGTTCFAPSQAADNSSSSALATAPEAVSTAGYRAGVAPAQFTEVNYPRRGVYGRPYTVYRPYARHYSGYRPYYRYSPYGVRAYGFSQPYGYYYGPRIYGGVGVY